MRLHKNAKIELLKSVPLFSRCTKKELGAIAAESDELFLPEGSERNARSDAQATLYQSGHFLKSHSDKDSTGARAAAYVLNFTRLWERDWGGYLQFFNDEHDIELALRPIFNAMNIFLVPTDHSVGIVSPFAYGDRLSVTGWLRTDSPPGPIEPLD